MYRTSVILLNKTPRGEPRVLAVLALPQLLTGPLRNGIPARFNSSSHLVFGAQLWDLSSGELASH